MDFMVILQFIVLLGGIYLGVKLGGMGVGYAGGLGVIILAILGMKVEMKDIPMDVILIIASVISAITAMQVAGGLDYLVQVASKADQLPSAYRYVSTHDTSGHRPHRVFYDPSHRRSRQNAKHQAFRTACALGRILSSRDYGKPYFSGIRRHERFVREARR